MHRSFMVVIGLLNLSSLNVKLEMEENAVALSPQSETPPHPSLLQLYIVM
jgi:hypothetical protein